MLAGHYFVDFRKFSMVFLYTESAFSFGLEYSIVQRLASSCKSDGFTVLLWYNIIPSLINIVYVKIFVEQLHSFTTPEVLRLACEDSRAAVGQQRK